MITVYIFGEILCLPAITMQRLEAWANWVRTKLPPPRRCASAEGRYDSEYPDIERNGFGVWYDLNEVLAVERVVCRRLPHKHREIVQHYFVLRERPEKISRVVSIHRHELPRELRRSVLMIKNNLTMQ